MISQSSKETSKHSLAATSAQRKGEEFRDLYFQSMVWAKTTWLGKNILKPVTDLWLYQEVITKERPRVILETGTRFGGSAHFFASILELSDNKDAIVISVDHLPERVEHHPQIRYLIGDSVAPETLAHVKELAPNGIDLLSLDSDHSPGHILAELQAYGPLASRGGLMVVEDHWINGADDPLRTWDAEGYDIDHSLQGKYLMSFGTWFRKKGTR